MQKGVDGKTGRKEIDKVAASPSPSEGGDVRGYGGIRKEGMCLAGYGMKCVGDRKGRKIGLKGQCFILKIIKFRSQGIGL